MVIATNITATIHCMKILYRATHVRIGESLLGHVMIALVLGARSLQKALVEHIQW